MTISFETYEKLFAGNAGTYLQNNVNNIYLFGFPKTCWTTLISNSRRCYFLVYTSHLHLSELLKQIGCNDEVVNACNLVVSLRDMLTNMPDHLACNDDDWLTLGTTFRSNCPT